jgi:hypothetical protein
MGRCKGELPPGLARHQHPPARIDPLHPRFCDDRVKVLQADARLLTPEVLLEFTSDVSREAPAAVGAGGRSRACGVGGGAEGGALWRIKGTFGRAQHW